MIVIIEGKEQCLYPAKIDDGTDIPVGLVFISGDINGFGGLNHVHLQILKSAAGYYIGALCFDFLDEERTKPYYSPNFRDSESYFQTREDAENAFMYSGYDVKF